MDLKQKDDIHNETFSHRQENSQFLNSDRKKQYFEKKFNDKKYPTIQIINSALKIGENHQKIKQSILPLVKKFINKLKDSTKFRNVKFLKYEQFSKINDLSSHFDLKNYEKIVHQNPKYSKNKVTIL